MRHAIYAACAAVAMVASASYAQAPQQQAPQKQSPAAQPGTPPGSVQRVDAASVVMTFYTANPADFRVSSIMGKSVYNLNNESIGEVNDIIINDGKTIRAIIIGVGGFLGIGERNVAVDPASVVLSEQSDGSARLVVNTTRDDLKKAPAFNLADVDKAGPNAGRTTGSGSGGTGSAPPARK